MKLTNEVEQKRRKDLERLRSAVSTRVSSFISSKGLVM